MSTQPPKIALIGCGPVSLTLASILQKHTIPFVIYEASPSIRTQGGTLDLHPSSGQAALKESGLWAQFAVHSRPESDVLKIVSMDGDVLFDENTCDKHEVQDEEKFERRPEIDRKVLVEMLYQNVNNDAIRFNKKLAQILPSTTPEGKYDLKFSDGMVEGGFDLVVGADGAWSRVREFLTDVKPRYSGISALELWIDDVHGKPWVRDYVGEGSLFCFGEGCAVQAQRIGDGSLRCYASQRVPEDFFEKCGMEWEKKGVGKEFVEKYFAHASHDVKKVVIESDDNVIPRTLYELPVGFKWEHHPGVTLVGDAAHVMTPFAGVGVNVGMTDSLVLGREIVKVWKGGKTLDAALKDYENEMWPRAQKFAEKTEEGKLKHFSEKGGVEFAHMLRAHYAAQPKGATGA
ncbi:FAD/NAD(P)-binding domain-containing protein [Lojkania enalia]|uniref:FAD/NAD(P)-binding domain-containing protein n=1 Tax=Lojkania enalia TaxID=147567 RepID=A0A9P4N069_9PLEO|nr:FAD/NAD(P)-binding domain-containing protein [Didymosphaeria enalia]